VWDAAIRLLAQEAQVVPRSLALWFAAFSILANEGLYWYTLSAARRVNSELLKANAWHHRSDAASSVIVLLAVGGALAGFPWLDAVGAAGVAIMIAWIGASLVRRNVKELVDTGLDPEQVEAIRSKILAVDGVRDMHLLRTRSMGSKALVDVHILLLDARVSVSEGHQISEAVRAELIQAFDEVDDVTVHIDPEDDELAPPSQHLPLRGEVLRRLNHAWSDIEASQSIRHVTIHYLDGKLHADVELPLEVVPDAKQAPALAAALAEAAQGDPDVAEVRVFFY
ncbi:MAG: cation-efflux pump, partial [Gammaproteobacteria bacterium]